MYEICQSCGSALWSAAESFLKASCLCSDLTATTAPLFAFLLGLGLVVGSYRMWQEE